jgi:hypothetical protein
MNKQRCHHCKAKKFVSCFAPSEIRKPSPWCRACIENLRKDKRSGKARGHAWRSNFTLPGSPAHIKRA